MVSLNLFAANQVNFSNLLTLAKIWVTSLAMDSLVAVCCKIKENGYEITTKNKKMQYQISLLTLK